MSNLRPAHGTVLRDKRTARERVETFSRLRHYHWSSSDSLCDIASKNIDAFSISSKHWSDAMKAPFSVPRICKISFQERIIKESHSLCLGRHVEQLLISSNQSEDKRLTCLLYFGDIFSISVSRQCYHFQPNQSFSQQFFDQIIAR